MDPGALVERLKRYAVDSDLPDPEVLDLRDDLTVDRVASVLLERFHRRNDAEALALVYEVAHGRLVEIARGITSRFALAIDPEDLVAAFLTRLFTDVRRPQPVVRHFLGLAHTSMRNDALNQLRSHNRSLRRMILFQSRQLPPADPAQEADDREQERTHRRLGVLFLTIVGECFHELGERDRRALLAREVEHLSYEGVAQVLEVPSNQVGAVIRRARQRFADRIARALAAGGQGES